MKRILLSTLSFLIMAMLSSAGYADNLHPFGKITEIPGVESNYISPEEIRSESRRAISSIAAVMISVSVPAKSINNILPYALSGFRVVEFSDALRPEKQNITNTISEEGIRYGLEAIKSIEFMTCEGKKRINKAKKLTNKIIKEMNLKIIFETIDDGEILRIYISAPRNNHTSNILAMYNDETEYSLSSVTGDIDIKRLMGID